MALVEPPHVNSAEAQRQLLEKTLIQRVLVGDGESFCELVRPYKRSVFFRALSIFGNEADAEEIVQDTILKAFRNLFQFRCESKFSTWFTQIAINEARIKLRKDKRHLFEPLDNQQLTDNGRRPKGGAQWRETPLESLEREELWRTVSSSLES